VITPVEKGLGIGAIVGIVLAIAVALGLLIFGGKKGYDYYQGQREKITATSANPLYQAKNSDMVNPMYSSETGNA